MTFSAAHRQLVGQLRGRLHQPAEDVDDRAPQRVHLRRLATAWSGAASTRATRYGSVPTKSSSRIRSSPWTIRRTLPSGARASWWIMPTVPTRWRSSGVGRLRLRIALRHQRQQPVAAHHVVDEPDGARLADDERAPRSAGRRPRPGAAGPGARRESTKSRGAGAAGRPSAGLRALRQRDAEQATVVARLDSLGVDRRPAAAAPPGTGPGGCRPRGRRRPRAHEGSRRCPSTTSASSKSWTSKSSSSTPASSTTTSIVVAVSYVSASGRQRDPREAGAVDRSARCRPNGHVGAGAHHHRVAVAQVSVSHRVSRAPDSLCQPAVPRARNASTSDPSVGSPASSNS